MMRGPMKLKDAMCAWRCSVPYIYSVVEILKVIQRKGRKCGRDTTIDKVRVFLDIDSQLNGHFDITILGKVMEKNWVVIVFYSDFLKKVFGPPSL